MRRATLLVVLLFAAVFPGSALAVTPPNDDPSGAQVLVPSTLYGAAQLYPIPSGFGLGGWEDAGNVNDPQPTCVPASQSTYNSLWYSVVVSEPTVLTVQVSTSTSDASQYQPVATVLSSDLTHEYACGRAGSDSETSPTATASSYLDAGTYLIRVASVTKPPTSPAMVIQQAPTVILSVRLRDVTPPAISVLIPAKIVGVDKKYTFNPSGSTDLGSGIDWASAIWTFYENGVSTTKTAPDATSAAAAEGSHVWKTTGFHKVVLALNDVAGNGSTYTFFVYVHSYVLPKISVSLSVPLPGASSIRLVLKHSLPVNVRLVVFQGGKLLRLIPKKLVKGKNKSSKIVIALRTRVKKKGGEVTISGMASTLGTYPNSVPLPTCAVDPVKGTGSCF
jgi:hypothetical protein